MNAATANEENIIEGAPALTTESKLACFYGGVISIVKEQDFRVYMFKS